MDYAMLLPKKEKFDLHKSEIPKEALASFDKSFAIEYTHNSTAI